MMMNQQTVWCYQLHVSYKFLLLIVLTSGCSSTGNDASIEQLEAEMNQRIELISRSETEVNIESQSNEIYGNVLQKKVIPRFNQAKTVACLNAHFQVHDKLPENLQHGIFSSAKNYPAILRFANATNHDDSKKDIRGVSIRLSNVEGDILWGQPGIQDFIFNSYPALFVATPEQFLEFIQARQEDAKLSFFFNPFNPHLKSFWIVFKAREKHKSLFDIRYWSTVPFQLGEATDQVMKYSLIPCSDYTTKKVVSPGEHQFRGAMKKHLKQTQACFYFAVQPQVDVQTMPIEDASVIWDETVSPFQKVATIRISEQNFDTPDALKACEQSSFNPWQSLSAHKPLGKMNAVRRSVYDKAAKLRGSGFK